MGTIIALIILAIASAEHFKDPAIVLMIVAATYALMPYRRGA